MDLRPIEDMEEPDTNKPDRTIKKKEGRDWDHNDLEFKMECEEYIKDMEESRLKRGYWEENQPWAYNLVLQYCPLELETRLTT